MSTIYGYLITYKSWEDWKQMLKDVDQFKRQTLKKEHKTYQENDFLQFLDICLNSVLDPDKSSIVIIPRDMNRVMIGDYTMNTANFYRDLLVKATGYHTFDVETTLLYIPIHFQEEDPG